MSFVDFIKEKYGELDHEAFGKEFHEDCLDEQLALSSNEPLAHETSDPKEEMFDEVPEELGATQYENLGGKDSIEDYAFHLVLKEASCDDDVHLHGNILVAIIVSKVDKGKGIFVEFPFQISDHDDEIFEELKGIDFLEKPLEEQEITSDFTSLSDEKHGGQEDDDVGILFVTGRHIWDVDC